MTVEIKELILKAVVNNSYNQNDKTKENFIEGISKSEIIEECINQILIILQRQKER
jgi:hypothetical protein